MGICTWTPFDSATLSSIVSTEKPVSTLIAGGEIINFTYSESSDITEEARYLYAYFRASYALSNFEAALTKVRNERSTSKSIYAFATKEGNTEALTGGPKWPKQLASEAVSNSNDRAAQFASEFGSHYISRISYGQMIIVRATINDTSSAARTQLSAKLKLGIAKIAAGGKLDIEETNYFQSAEISIVATVISGGTEPSRPLVMTNIVDLADFLGDWKTNKFVIKDTAVRATLSSWWPWLTNFPKTRAVFSPAYQPPLQAPHGVPKGSIIAWIPPSDMIDKTAPETPKPLFPDGWHLCDGEQGSPNIGNAFLYGALTFKDVGSWGGSTEHEHSASLGDNNKIKNELGSGDKDAADAYHSHPITIAKSPHLPPFFRAMWICKL